METYQRRIVLLLTEIIFWFNGYSQTNGNRRGGFTLLSVTIAVQVVLWVRSSIRLSIWISPGNWDARVGLGNWVTNSASFHLICRYSDSCNFASSKSLMQWADTRKQMRRNFNCTQREKIDHSGTISATLGAYVKNFEVSFAFWAASLWRLSCSFLFGFIIFCDYWKFQQKFSNLEKKQKAIQWTNLFFTKLSTICNLWVIYW